MQQYIVESNVQLTKTKIRQYSSYTDIKQHFRSVIIFQLNTYLNHITQYSNEYH